MRERNAMMLLPVVHVRDTAPPVGDTIAYDGKGRVIGWRPRFDGGEKIPNWQSFSASSTSTESTSRLFRPLPANRGSER